MINGESLIEIQRDANPFARTDVVRDSHGIAHYSSLPPSLVHMLSEQVEVHPEVEAAVEVGGDRLTYRDLWSRAARVAGGLRNGGVVRGDRVALRQPPGIEWTLAFWGTLMSGAVPVAVNTRSTKAEIDFLLRDCGAKVDLAPPTRLPDADPYVERELSLNDLAAIFYTSGTTGNPKGVPTSHEAFLTNAENARRCFGFPQDAGRTLRTLISAPLFHVTACNSQFVTAAYLGGTSVILPKLDFVTLIDTLATEKISYLVTVPAVYALMLRDPHFDQADTSMVKWVGYGGAPITPSLVHELKQAFPTASVFNGYGMTETASLITALPDAFASEHADSVGYAVPSIDLALLPISTDPNVGELLVRGANVTKEYWNQPDGTTAAFVDGWLKTGDVVRVDDAGRVHIVDRIKDIINRGGEKVSSIEVETILAGAPGVAEVAVIAVPDSVMGEKVGAVLVADDTDIDLSAVLDHCREHLADFKIPQHVAVHSDPLPRNPGGKLLKSRLRELVQWGPAFR